MYGLIAADSERLTASGIAPDRSVSLFDGPLQRISVITEMGMDHWRSTRELNGLASGPDPLALSVSKSEN